MTSEVAAENSGVETIRKVLEHVRRIWFDVPEDCLALRTDALRLYRIDQSPDTVLLLIWGMAIAAYPFVGSVGETLGRLLRLQKEALRSDVQRRLREQFGDRDFVSRITRYNVSSFLDWNVIAETEDGGAYRTARKVNAEDEEQMAWLIEAVLISRNVQQMPLPQILHHPLLFPVRYDNINVTIVRANRRLKSIRQGLNEDLVILEHGNGE